MIQQTDRYEDHASQELVSMWGYLDRRIQAMTKQRGQIEMILTQRLEADEATALPHEDFEVAFKEGSPSWDYGKLASIRELVPPEELAAGYTPAHQKTIEVPDSWNMTKIKPLAKYGGEVKQVIESARIPGRRRLSIKAKAKKEESSE